MTEKLRQRFKDYFETPGLELPSPIPERGEVKGGDWVVRYVQGKSASGEIYVDFFARNRHTNSRHERVKADGSLESLENYQEALIFESEADEDWGKASAKMEAHNQKVTKILEEKGLIE